MFKSKSLLHLKSWAPAGGRVLGEMGQPLWGLSTASKLQFLESLSWRPLKVSGPGEWLPLRRADLESPLWPSVPLGSVQHTRALPGRQALGTLVAFSPPHTSLDG